MTRRPERTRAHDRTLGHDDNHDRVACDMALAPFDRAATALERKWGIGRLESLVTPEMAATWGRTMANLNAALDAVRPSDVVACVNSALRGLKAMDEAATRAGHKPAEGRIFEHEITDDNGQPFRFAILDDVAEWQTAHDRRPDLTFYTKDQIGRAMLLYERSTPVEKLREHFPKAKITDIRFKSPSGPVIDRTAVNEAVKTEVPPGVELTDPGFALVIRRK